MVELLTIWTHGLPNSAHMDVDVILVGRMRISWSFRAMPVHFHDSWIVGGRVKPSFTCKEACQTLYTHVCLTWCLTNPHTVVDTHSGFLLLHLTQPHTIPHAKPHTKPHTVWGLLHGVDISFNICHAMPREWNRTSGAKRGTVC